MPISRLVAQGISDSIIVLKSVEITTKQSFVKEESGMKENKVDSLIMIEKMGSSLSELLSENTPIFIKNHGRGALATASFRGTAASHTQVAWNGININSPMTGMVDFSLIPVYVIDDIDLKHGTASIADNSGGIGGSINIGNSCSNDTTLTFTFLQGIGSYQSFDEFLKVGWGNEIISLKTRVYYNYSKNDYTFINKNIVNINPQTGAYEHPLDTNNNGSYNMYGLMQEVYFKINTNNVISAKYWGQESDRSIPQATSYEGPENSNLNNQTDFNHKLSIDWAHFSAKSKLSVKSGYTNEKLLYTLQNFVSGVGLIPAVYSESLINSFVNKVSYNYDFNDKLSIEGSLDANYYKVWSQDSIKKTGYDVDRKEISAFLSINKNFFDRLNLTLMMRQDIIDGKLVPFVPYFGFDYKILENSNLIVKGNIAKNYHQPSLNDLYWQPGGNENLLPENGFSTEMGLEYLWNNEKFDIKSELTYFRSDINNWIIWIPTFKGYWEPMNINRVISQGIEADLSFNWQIMNNLKINTHLNYSYTDAKNLGNKDFWGEKSYGKQLVYVPLHSANAMINISYCGFYATYQFNYYSERFTTSSNDYTKRDWLYPYFMNDIYFGKLFKIKHVNLYLEFKVYNILNESYHSILYRPMPGRNYLLELKIKY